jgi:hypothetical protein
VIWVGCFLSAVLGALEEKCGGEEREKGEDGPVNDEIDVHDVPLRLVAQTWIDAPNGAAAMFDLRGSGLRGRRTLEERGPYVVVRCNNVVLAWLIRDACLDRFEEEEDGDKKEEGRGVMVRRMGKDEEQHGDEGCEERDCFPVANFWGPCHRWIECTAPV